MEPIVRERTRVSTSGGALEALIHYRPSRSPSLDWSWWMDPEKAPRMAGVVRLICSSCAAQWSSRKDRTSQLAPGFIPMVEAFIHTNGI